VSEPTSTRPARPVRAGDGPIESRPARRGKARRPGRRRLTAWLVLLGIGGLTAIVVGLLGPVQETIKEITLPLRHEDIIRQQAREKQLDPALIAAVIYGESKFRDRTSDAGAKGLMQVLPATAQFVARRTGGTSFQDSDLSDPQINISYGSWYLRYLLDLYDGNRVAAVAAYNAGRRRVDDWGGKQLTLEEIRFAETRVYTETVLDKRDEYAKRYRKELGL
jgi:soluble lytic murein transglycosylase